MPLTHSEQVIMDIKAVGLDYRQELVPFLSDAIGPAKR